MVFHISALKMLRSRKVSKETHKLFNYFAIECLTDSQIHHTSKQQMESKLGSYLNLFLSSRSILCNLSSLS